MSEFKKLKLKQFPQIQDRETSEARYWKSYKSHKTEKLYGTPYCVNFDPTGSGSYLVTASTKISLYDGNTDKVQKSFSRFQDDAFSGKFRKDGKLLVCGDKTGYVKVFDVGSKALLRQAKRHSAPVRSTVWASDGLHMISGSDDKSVKVWDLGGEEVIWENSDVHSDYIRTVDASPIEPNVFLSGSYDHSLQLWDRRQEKPSLTMINDCPISHCMITASGSMLISAGNNQVKVWDLLGGGRLLHTFSNHQKNVTSLAMDITSSRLISCGLDGHVKIYNFHDMQVAHGFKCAAPLMCVAISPDSQKLVLGHVDGTLEVRAREKDMLRTAAPFSVSVEESADFEEGSGAGSSSSSHLRQRRFYKGAVLGEGSQDDEEERDDPAGASVVDSLRPQRLRSYEVHLKKFNYQLALDAALKTRNPLVVVTLLEELCRRNALVVALSGRDEVTLEPLLAFLSRYVSSSRYARLIIQVMIY